MLAWWPMNRILNIIPVAEDTALGWGRIESHSEFGQANKNVILNPEQQWENCSQLLEPEWKGQASNLCVGPSR